MTTRQATQIDWEKVREIAKQTLGRWTETAQFGKGSTFTQAEAKMHLKIGVHNYFSIGFGTRHYGWIPLDGEYNVLPYPKLTKTRDGQYWTDKSPEEIDFDEVMRKVRFILYFHYCDWEGVKEVKVCEIKG